MKRKSRTVEVELSPERECSRCGCLGLHMCVGRRDYWENPPVAYIGTRRSIDEKGRKHPP